MIGGELTSRLDDALVGARVAGLRIERVVAEGGIGIVYAGRSEATGEKVAIKVLQERHAADAGLVRRFEREAGYARRVRHPNVVSALADGQLADGRPYFVMELLSGSTLGAVVRGMGPLPIERALAIGDDLLAGLEAIHAARIVHRDLSPENVFLERADDGRPRARILDFGFAHAPGVDTGDGVSRDSQGALVGTPRFMSPEQATSGRAINERSDLFTAALLLHYALSGKLPFRGERDHEVLVSILRAAPTPLRRARRDVPAALDALIARALAKHPDARFDGAAEMRAALLCVRASIAGSA